VEQVLLVSRCAGMRCAALMQLRDDHRADPVATALRQRRDGVLLRTNCLGPCHLGAVAMAGWAACRKDHRWRWQGPPLLANSVDTEQAARSLAEWIEQRPHDQITRRGARPGV